MHSSLWTLAAAALALFAIAAPPSVAQEDTAGKGVKAAIQKTAALRGYAFQIVDKPGTGTGGGLQGKYETGQPVFFLADKIESAMHKSTARG